MDNGFVPFRRDVDFLNCTEVPISPLIPNLTFIQNKKNWGYIFRLGLFEIQNDDFDLISSQMLSSSTAIYEVTKKGIINK